MEPRNGIPARIAEQWRKIEAIDYSPLSTIASEMLEDADVSPQIGETPRAVYAIASERIDAGGQRDFQHSRRSLAIACA